MNFENDATQALILADPLRRFNQKSRIKRMQTTFTIELPTNLSKDEAQLLLAVKLFEVGKVSLGQAAKLAGFSKRAFIEVLGRYHIPVANYSPDELQDELL
jgi:predicted HTH domain antitoxin